MQEYWSGLPCPTPGDLPNPGIEPVSHASPVLQVDSFPLSHWESPYIPSISSVQLLSHVQLHELHARQASLSISNLALVNGRC